MKLNIYISHADSQKDEVERFRVHLHSLKQENVSIFSRFDLKPGDDWKLKIESELGKADLILCLINADYICDREKEILSIEIFFESKIKTIIPILLGECFLDYSFFNRLTPIKHKGKTSVNNEKLWLRVTEYISNFIQDHSKKEPSITEFTIAPYKASAGLSSEYGQLRSVPTNTIKLRNYLKGDLLFEISGDSMSPYVNHGDYVHTRKCENAVTNGEVYVIETFTSGIMIKMIELNKDTLNLKSINKDFRDFTKDKTEIKSLWSIINKININPA